MPPERSRRPTHAIRFRGYSGKKLTDNMEAEIMQVILDEAREAYQEEIVIELPSSTVEDIEANVERTVGWLRAWKPRAD